MIAAASDSKEIWYLMRGTGLVSLLLFTLTVIAGIVNVKRVATRRWPRLVTALLHRNVALLALAFLAVHIITAEMDKYVSVGWWAALVPFTSGWRPAWVGLGTLGIDCLLAIVATSLLRARLSQRVWRAVHWLAYGSWPLALVHGLGAGTDSSTGWARALYVSCITGVVAAVVWRFGAAGSTKPATTRAGRFDRLVAVPRTGGMT